MWLGSATASQRQPKVLFVHNGWPGRFNFLAAELASIGASCVHLGGPELPEMPNARSVRYTARRGSTPGIFEPATRAEADLLRGAFAAEVALDLKRDDFSPDLIIGHPAWGEMVFLREVFPTARQIQIGEMYYRTSGLDLGFDPEFENLPPEQPWRGHAKNAVTILSMAEADRIVSPTKFQAGTFRPM